MTERQIRLRERTALPDAIVGESERDTLWWLYDQTYEVATADSHESNVEAHALRYQVYCLEKGFEDPAANPLGLEIDAFDARSRHCLLRHRETRIALGTARLILPDPLRPHASWPIQQVCRDPRLFGDAALPTATTAEVSRFCLSSDARARIELGRGQDVAEAADDKRLAPYTILGIIRGMLMVSLRRGVTHWTLIVEPALLRLLGRLGLHFTKLGPLVEYHGRRQPCFSDLAGLFERMREERPDLWRIVTACGRFSPDGAAASETAVTPLRPGIGGLPGADPAHA